MKIIASCRTLNEATRVEKFCQAYQFADEILIADGGSEDNTVELALKYPKVQVRNYDVKVELKDGSWRNPDGPHIQFLVDWAAAESGDWLIHQDCDQRPNKFLKADARDILTDTDKDFVMVTQIYIIENNMYFSDLSHMGGDWAQGLWAWRLSTGLRIIDKMPHYEFSFDGEKSVDFAKVDNKLNILPPYCFMHFGWETEEQIKAHVDYYNRTHLIPNMLHPKVFGGKPSPLEDWMIE